MEKIIKKLKEEQNKTADWIEFMNKKIDLMENKIERIDVDIKKILDNQNIIAQHILHFHKHLKLNKIENE